MSCFKDYQKYFQYGKSFSPLAVTPQTSLMKVNISKMSFEIDVLESADFSK
ncbi:hypothetical protein [Methanobrevibacter sp.]